MFFVHNEKLVGPYRLIAVDALEDMSLVWTIPSGGFVGDGLPDQTVFAAGFDDKYVVAARHPKKLGHPVDRSVTEYFYLVRTEDEYDKLPYSGINGPLSLSEFAQARDKLNLPEFSVVFDELK